MVHHLSKHLLISLLLALTGLPLAAQKKKDIKEIEIVLPQNLSLHPGQTFEIGAKVTYHNGKIKTTKTLMGGKLSWSKLAVSVQAGRASDGRIYLDPDPRKFPGYTATISVADPKRPQVSATQVINLDFKGAQTAYFNGGDGKDGKDGSDGETGADGNGSDGTSGGVAEWGASGSYVFAYVKAVTMDDNTTYLKVLIEDLVKKKKARYIVSTTDGSLLIDVSGGDGGNGGDGGDGGDGRDKTEEEDPGDGGDGGDGGAGGNGGSGGQITLYADPSAKPYLNLITHKIDGGIAGHGGDGGKKGKGGADPDSDKSTIGKVLFGSGGSRGSRGSDGPDGAPGETGTFKVEEQEVTLDF